MEDQDLNQNESTTTPDDLAKKCEEYLAGWKRAQADYANLKKETDREKTEFAKFANERLLREILPAIDQFETALAFTPDLSTLPEDQRKQFQNWVIGLKAVRSSWETAFKDIGLEQIVPSGEFDPLIAEAVGHEAMDGVGEGHVAKVMQTGWRLNGKLLRPAKVVISKSN